MMGIRLLLPATLALVAACGQTPTPPPSSDAPSTAPSASPTATLLTGSAELQVTGAAREPCIAPPSGCGYGVTLVVPGGGSYHAAFVPAVEGGPLLPDIGLPASLPPGSYLVAFEATQHSDQLRQDETGATITEPPISSIGCAETFSVGSRTKLVRMRVVFDGSDCEVRIRRR